MLRRIGLMLTLLLLPGSEARGQTAEPVAYQNRPDAARVRLTEPGGVVFRAAAAWEAFGIEHPAGTDGSQPELPPPLPRIDFRHRMLIGIFWGARSGCPTSETFVERIEHVVRDGSDLVVELQALGPLGPCRAVSWPVPFIEVPRVDGEVVISGIDPAR